VIRPPPGHLKEGKAGQGRPGMARLGPYAWCENPTWDACGHDAVPAAPRDRRAPVVPAGALQQPRPETRRNWPWLHWIYRIRICNAWRLSPGAGGLVPSRFRGGHRRFDAACPVLSRAHSGPAGSRRPQVGPARLWAVVRGGYSPRLNRGRAWLGALRAAMATARKRHWMRMSALWRDTKKGPRSGPLEWGLGPEASVSAWLSHPRLVMGAPSMSARAWSAAP